MQFNFAPRPISGAVLPKINAVEEGQFFNWDNHGERQLYLASAGMWIRIQIGDTLRLDDLYVKNLHADKFYFRQINASNGDDMVTDTAEVDKVEGVTIYFKDASGYNLCPFQANDLIIAKRITMDKSLNISYVQATVTSVSGRAAQVIYYSDATFKKGDTVVKVGNTTDTTRQDSILLSTNGAYSPYIDVYDGISTWSGTGTNNWDYKVPMVSIGNLKKINATYTHGIYIGNNGQLIIAAAATVSGLSAHLPNIVTIYSITAPTTRTDGSALVAGDLWIDSDDNNHQYRWNGTTWIDIKDWSANWNYLINKPSYVGTPSGTGLFIDTTHMGYYEAGAWKTYIDNTGKYYFTGDANNYISWNGTTQTIKGNIIITGGSGIASLTDANQDNIVDGTTYKRVTATEKTGAGRAYNAIDISGNLTTSVIPTSTITPSGAGLYLSSNYMGYYNGTVWKTYMNNTGVLSCNGTSASLTWNPVADTLSVIGGTITGSTFQTATSGARIIIGQTGEAVARFYDATGGTSSLFESGGKLCTNTDFSAGGSLWANGYLVATQSWVDSIYAYRSLNNTMTGSNYFEGTTTFGKQSTTNGSITIYNLTNNYSASLTATGTTVSNKSINLPDASGTVALQGWVTSQGFAISATSPISLSAGNISITQSNTSTNGYLSSTDWNTFNGKSVVTTGSALDIYYVATTSGGSPTHACALVTIFVNGISIGSFLKP